MLNLKRDDDLNKTKSERDLIFLAQLEELKNLFRLASSNFNEPHSLFLAKTYDHSFFIDKEGNKKAKNAPYIPGDILRGFYGPRKGQKHIIVDYHPQTPSADQPEKLVASGLKYNIKNDPLPFFIERSFAARVMAEQAISLGWKNVTLGDTKDPHERYILYLVCQQSGLNVTEPVEEPKEAKTIQSAIKRVMNENSLHDIVKSEDINKKEITTSKWPFIPKNVEEIQFSLNEFIEQRANQAHGGSTSGINLQILGYDAKNGALKIQRAGGCASGSCGDGASMTEKLATEFLRAEFPELKVEFIHPQPQQPLQNIENPPALVH